jgi:hypothetical protein
MDKATIVTVRETQLNIDNMALAKDLLEPDELAHYMEFKDKKLQGIPEDMLKMFQKIFTFPLKTISIYTEIKGAPPEMANALRRAAAIEQRGYALNITYDDVLTSDKDMNIMEIVKNIDLLPLVYDLDEDVISQLDMYIDIINDTPNILPVLAGDIKFRKNIPKYHIFYPTTELIYLNIGCKLQVKNIKIMYGYDDIHTKFITGTNSVVWPLSKGQPPMHHKITFKMNAVSVSAKDTAKIVLVSGCIDILSRLASIHETVKTNVVPYFREFEDHVELVIQETNTISRMLERAIYIMNPDISYVSGTETYHEKTITVVVHSTNAKKIMLDAIMACINLYVSLKEQLQYN